MTQMMEMMNFVMGNSGSRSERPRWADYEDFKEAVDDIGDAGFEDEAIGHREGFRQPRNQRDYGNRTRGQFGQRENFRSVGEHADLDGDLDAIKLKIPSFQGKKISRHIWSCRKRWIGFLIAITIQRRRK
jgi:hypothetical protein